MNEKIKRRLIFTFMIACFIGIFLVIGLIVDELTDDKPTQALCDDMFELMGDPVHTQLHKDYVETMQLLHLFIQECHANGNYDEDYDPNAMIGMTEMPMSNSLIDGSDGLDIRISTTLTESLKLEEQRSSLDTRISTTLTESLKLEEQTNPP